MRDFHFAVWAPGVSDIAIYSGDGRGVGTYSCGSVVRAVALGPRYFAFLTSNGVFCIDADTHETWSV